MSVVVVFRRILGKGYTVRGLFSVIRWLKTRTCSKLNGCRISRTIAAIDYHVISSWCLVLVSARRVSLGYQLRQSQLTHVDRRRFRFESDQQVIRTIRRRYTGLPAMNNQSINQSINQSWRIYIAPYVASESEARELSDHVLKVSPIDLGQISWTT